MISKTFRNELQEQIQLEIDSFSDFLHLNIMTGYKQFLKFDSDKNFWYGYLIGKIESNCSRFFELKYNRPFEHEEYDEMVNIVQDYGHLIQKRIDEKFRGMFGIS